jgi:hypothetical protein
VWAGAAARLGSERYRGPWVTFPTARTEDTHADALAILEHSAVPEPQDPQAAALKVHGAPRVVRDLVSVLAAVELDDQARLPAEEVENERSERDLPSPAPAPNRRSRMAFQS